MQRPVGADVDGPVEADAQRISRRPRGRELAWLGVGLGLELGVGLGLGLGSGSGLELGLGLGLGLL